MKFFQVRNWDQFQHYKDRSPIWIKLYNDLLDNYNFTCLPDASKAHLVAIWMLASRNNNRLPQDKRWLEARICATESLDLELLFSSGFIEEITDKNQQVRGMEQSASSLLASRKQNDTVTVPRGEERRGEDINQKTSLSIGEPSENDKLAKSQGWEPSFSPDEPQNKSMPSKWRPNEKHYSLAACLGVDADSEHERFRDYCEANNKQYFNWNSAFNNWLRRAPELNKGKGGSNAKSGNGHHSNRRAASPIERMLERERSEGANRQAHEGTLEENGRDVRSPLDVEFRREY